MTEAEFIGICQNCEGTGVNKYQDEEGHWHERPCPYCGATGKVEVKQYIDTTAIMAELDEIHNKVNKIWNKIKD